MSFEDFCKIISDITGIPLKDIHADSSFRDDLAIDSLKMVNLIVEFTSKYNADLNKIESINDISTVGGFYSILIGGNFDDIIS